MKELYVWEVVYEVDDILAETEYSFKIATKLYSFAEAERMAAEIIKVKNGMTKEQFVLTEIKPNERVFCE